MLIFQGGQNGSLSTVDNDFASLGNNELEVVQTRTELGWKKLFNWFFLEVLSSKELLLCTLTGHIRTKGGEEVGSLPKETMTFWNSDMIWKDTCFFLLKSVLE